MRDKKKREAQREVLRKLGIDIREGVRIKLADGYYRLRRGKLVRIPDEWVGKPFERCGSPKQWREYKFRRQSKGSRKLRRRGDMWDKFVGRIPRDRREKRERGPGYIWARRLGHPRNRSPRHLPRQGRRPYRDDEFE